MSVLALLLTMLTGRGVAAEAVARPVSGQTPSREFTRDSATVPPYLAFPEPGLDDPAAYEGYETRVYQDAAGNAFQVYLKGTSGRVVNLWADAANESVGFTAHDSAGRPAELAWASSGALVTRSARTRSVTYSLELPSPATIGLFLLGSMRVERDLQYAGRDSLPLHAAPFPQPELVELIDRLGRLAPAERARHLALLGVKTVDALRARLRALATTERRDTTWVVRIEQERFDGKGHLSVALEGDTRETVPALMGEGGNPTVTITRPAGGPVRVAVRVTTDAAALTPLSRDEIFNDAFQRFAAGVRADTGHPLRAKRLEREIRGVELLAYREKLMAGLPNFATYFGRDMLMTALLMEPVWAPAMPEHVIASALRKLAPAGDRAGDVSHEEALGGQAIREHVAEYNRLVAAGRLAAARAVLAHLDATRENYGMVDDDFQLPIVAARYFADPRVPAERKRRFLAAEDRLPRLVANLALVSRRAAAYARHPVATNLVSFPRAPDGQWLSASWRDSRAGYGGGRFAFDVNAIWVPHALEAVGAILDALKELGLAPVIRAEPLATYARDRKALEHVVGVWQGAERHFRVTLTSREVRDRTTAKLRSQPPAAGEYWSGVLQRLGTPPDTFRFLALSLDAAGRPIPIVNTDPATSLLVQPALDRERMQALLEPIMVPYPWGLFVDDLGPVVANDVYAGPEVWASFRRDAYHSPTVVWGREVNILLAGLARQKRVARSRADSTSLEDALQRTITAVDRSGLRHAELWSYRIENGRLVPARYGTSSDVQLWSLTDLAVQFLLEPTRP